MPFEYNCILVTGATSGIGRALAQKLAELPHKPTVIAVGRRQDRLDQLEKSSVDGRIKGLSAELGKGRESSRQFVEQVLANFPNLDAIILCHGIQRATDWSRAETLDLDVLEDEFQLNYTTNLQLIVGFLPHLKKQGKGLISPVSSGLGIVPKPGVANYSASKAALHSLSMSLRSGLSGSGIRVREILPPLVESEIHDHQRTTEAAAKIWMPLDQYVNETVDQFVNTENEAILSGTSVQAYERFEKGKDEFIRQKFGASAFSGKKD